MTVENLFALIPPTLASEAFEDIVNTDSIRIERILSKGHTSPETGWYDQEGHEWVLVLQGSARVAFDDGREVFLGRGDYINIPAHEKHRVSWTDPDQVTVWLAVFYA